MINAIWQIQHDNCNLTNLMWQMQQDNAIWKMQHQKTDYLDGPARQTSYVEGSVLYFQRLCFSLSIITASNSDDVLLG